MIDRVFVPECLQGKTRGPSGGPTARDHHPHFATKLIKFPGVIYDMLMIYQDRQSPRNTTAHCETHNMHTYTVILDRGSPLPMLRTKVLPRKDKLNKLRGVHGSRLGAKAYLTATVMSSVLHQPSPTFSLQHLTCHNSINLPIVAWAQEVRFFSPYLSTYQTSAIRIVNDTLRRTIAFSVPPRRNPLTCLPAYQPTYQIQCIG